MDESENIIPVHHFVRAGSDSDDPNGPFEDPVSAPTGPTHSNLTELLMIRSHVYRPAVSKPIIDEGDLSQNDPI